MEYLYQKERSLFGRQCLFDDHNELIFTEPPNREYAHDYIYKNPVHMDAQLGNPLTLSEVNTDKVEMVHSGVNHYEGGWPKDVNIKDEEHTARYIKKVFRDDSWALKVPGLLKSMEHSISQTAAVDVYQKYFENMEQLPPSNECEGRTVTIFKDVMKKARPVIHMSWSPEGGHNIACSYCDPRYKMENSEEPISYIWNVENVNLPSSTIKSNSSCLCLEYNPKDNSIIAGGLLSGEVAIWDVRSGGYPRLQTEREISHRLQVNSVLWTHTKTNTEFYSGSNDGSIFWWDTRQMGAPIDKYYLETIDTNDQELFRSHGASVLEFEPTIPTRFMVGTEQGYVILGNRKGRNPTEKLLSKYCCYVGRVYSVERNTAYPKNFLTIGDYQAKIWSEESRESPIMWTRNQPIPLLSGTWSSTRCSLFFVTKQDGTFEAYDLLWPHGTPCLTIKLTNVPLISAKSHETGQIVACSNFDGKVYLVRLSENMYSSGKLERPAFSFMMERETKREKNYENRMKEAKLKYRMEQERLLKEHEEQSRSLLEKKKKKVDIKKLDDKRDKLLQKLIEEDEAESKTVAADGEEENEGDKIVQINKAHRLEVAQNEFEEATYAEKNRREKFEVRVVKTPFSRDFDYSTILRPEEADAERKKRIAVIKQKVVKGVLKLYRNQ